MTESIYHINIYKLYSEYFWHGVLKRTELHIFIFFVLSPNMATVWRLSRSRRWEKYLYFSVNIIWWSNTRGLCKLVREQAWRKREMKRKFGIYTWGKGTNLVKMGTCFLLKWNKTAGVHCCSLGERHISNSFEKCSVFLDRVRNY